MDITLEAVVYSAILGLRFLIVIGCAGLLAAAVDPDELLRAVRRVSVRSGRDRRGRDAAGAGAGARRAPARRRPADRGDGRRDRRVAVLRAVTAGALDRATDVAATLEVRGFALGAAGPARERRPWSRHDLAFAASAVALAVLGVAAALEGWARVRGVPAARAGARRRAAAARRRARRLRAAAVRRPPRGGAVSVLELDGVSYAYPGEPDALRDV